MKVVAKTGEGFLVEMTEQEIAQVFGKSSAYQAEINGKVKIGQIIDIGEMYSEAAEVLRDYAEIKR